MPSSRRAMIVLSHGRSCGPVAVLIPMTFGLLTAGDPPKIDHLFPAGGHRGNTVEVQLAGQLRDEPLQTWTEHGQLAIELSKNNAVATVTIPPDTKPGCHWLRFYNNYGAAELRPFLVGVIPEIQETEPNDTPGAAHTIDKQTVTVNGILDKPGDVDVYRINVPAGRTLVASLECRQQLGSPMDAVLQLVNKNGTVVAQNDDDHGFDPQLAFCVPSDSDWFVRVFGFPASPNRTIGLAGGADYIYRLTLTSGPFVDHTIPAVVTRHKECFVSLHGWNFGEDMPRVRVPATGDCVVLAEEHSALAYRIAGVDHDSLTESNAAQSLLPPVAVTGCIAKPGERDSWLLTGEPAENIMIDVSARYIDSLLDPVLRVTAADGKILMEADDRSGSDLDTNVNVTVPEDGRCVLEVTDRYGDSGERYYYVLTCRGIVPQFTATVSANAWICGSKTLLEIPVTIERIGGFADPITVAVEGLPDGVSAATVESAANGDTASAVTVKVERDAAATGFNGAVRIVCTSENSDRTKLATAPLPRAIHRTSTVWLTVTPPPAASDSQGKSDPD